MSTGEPQHEQDLDDEPVAPPSRVPLSPGDVLAGKYRVDRIVGFGGMGFVVEAWHLGFEERVAVKLLRAEVAANAEAQARFEREAKSAFKIKNEHVARVIDVGRLESGAPFMVMEFLEGTDLGEMLAEHHVLPVDEAVDYLLQAAEAIAEAHAIGIIHRDLKPENLFLAQRPDGTSCIKVLDFGLSKVTPKLPTTPRERTLTETKQVMGTAEYMSPEQWMSARDVGPATDIWSLGIMLFELVAGQTPFERDQLAQMCQAILGGKPPSLTAMRPDAPEGLEAIIFKCLAKDPSQRYANVSELASALIPFAPEHARAAAQRIANLGLGGAGVRSSAPPPASMSTPPSAPRAVVAISTPPPISTSPSAAPPRTVSTPPPVSSSPSAPPPRLARRVPVRSWAEILQQRPVKSHRGLLFAASLVLLVCAAVAVLVWTNRHALDPPPAGSAASTDASAAGTTSTAATSAASSGSSQSTSRSGASTRRPSTPTTEARPPSSRSPKPTATAEVTTATRNATEP